jgi:tetratricopeptide (TPR) repeat protein
MYRIILLLINSDFFFSKPAKSNEILKINIQPDKNLKYFAAFFGAISLAFSYQYWSQSQNTEAFIFTYFFVILFIYIFLIIEKKRKELIYSQNKKAEVGKFADYFFKTLAIVAFLYGLAMGANPTAAVLVPGVLLIVFLNRRILNVQKVAVLFLIGMITVSLVYSYLPIRASAWPFVNWGNPQTWSLFIGQLRGEGLNIYEPQSGSINGFTGSPIIFFQSVSHFFYLLLIQFTPILLPFLFAGGYSIYRKNKYLFWFLLSVILVDVFYAGLYYSGNQESWFILAWIICAIFIGIGFYYAILRFSLKSKHINALALLCFLPLLVWFIPLNRSQHYYSDDYAKNLYSTLNKNAILIGTGDFSNSLGFYLHEADKLREDVTSVTANVLYVNKWYRDGLRNASDIVVSPKLEDIIQYKAFDEYNRAMNSFIADNIDKHPIYVTHLTLRASALAATDAGQLVLDSRFKFIPHGLSLQVVPSNSNVKIDPKAFDFTFKTPNPQKPPFYLERNYNSGYKNLANDYAYSYEALGDWYFSSGNYDKAFDNYKKADSWSPNNSEILSRFGQYYGIKKELDVARQYFQKALNLSPDNFTIRFNLAITLANMGRIDEALQQYKIIEQYAAGSSIALDAGNQMALLSKPIQQSQASVSAKMTGNTFVSQTDNYSFDYPDGWSVTKNSQGLVSATNGKLGKQALNLAFFGKKITTPQRIDDFVKTGPLKQSGTLLDIQPINLSGGLKAFLQIWGQSGASSQVIVITNDLWAWQIAISPGDSTNMSDLYKILNTFKPLQ